MRKCTYCGRECSDDLVICPIDEQPLEGVGPSEAVPLKPKKNAGRHLELPLLLQRRPTIMVEPIDWLTISKEGLIWHESLPPLSLKWNEIAHLHLRGTRRHGGVLFYTTWDHITLILNGFELSPIFINVQGSTYRPKEVLGIITSTLNAFRNGRSVPPLARAFPKLAQAIEHPPVKIGFAKGLCIQLMFVGILIFLLIFVVPVCAAEGGVRLMVSLIFSPFAVIGLGMIILFGFRVARRDPVLVLAENSLIYARGRKHLSIPWHQINELQLRPSSKTVVVLHDQRTCSTSLKLGGLEHALSAIFYMAKNLHALHWIKANGVKTIAAIDSNH